MTDLVLKAMIESIPPTVVAVSGLVAILVKLREVKKRVDDNGVRMNGRLAELLALTRKTSYAEGEKHEREK